MHTQVFTSICKYTYGCVPSGSIRQHTSAYVSIRQLTDKAGIEYIWVRALRIHTSAYVSIR